MFNSTGVKCSIASIHDPVFSNLNDKKRHIYLYQTLQRLLPYTEYIYYRRNNHGVTTHTLCRKTFGNTKQLYRMDI